MIKMTEFSERRQKIFQHMGAKSIAIIPSASVTYRNADAEYPFRQHSDFYYLTGFEEPEAVAVFLPQRKTGEYILFNQARHRDEEIWTGYRAGQEGARKHYLADEAFPISSFEEKLPELLQDCEEVYYTLGIDVAFDQKIMRAINKIRRKIRNGMSPPLTFMDVSDVLHEMRLIKSAAEIELMRKAATISAEAHKRVMQYCKPGMYEYELEAELVHEFQRNGARFVAYNSIVGSGANACILHYTHNNKKIENNSLVLVDAGCEYQNYASDITRTFPANGTFSAEQAAIYDIVLAAQMAAIDTVKPGALWSAAQDIIVQIITQGLLDLGILQGSLPELIEKQAYLPFYMHKSGHWLGLDVHDVGYYKIDNQWRKLEAGMVLTVEPGIYISSDIPNVDKRWHNIGVRIEDDVLVTTKNNEVLSYKAPKTIKDIEAIMK